jgi:hypothetical protein
MQLAGSATSDSTPCVLQIVLRTAPSAAAVRRVLVALATVADRASTPKLVQASWSDLSAGKSIVRKAGSLPAALRRSPDRVAALTADCGDATGDWRIAGWDNVRREAGTVARSHFRCDAMAEHGPLVDAMSHVVELTIRFEHLVKASPHGWRRFCRDAVAAACEDGCGGTGVIDILSATPTAFGDAHLGFGQPQSYLRAVLWSRWVASAAAGEDLVPWPGQAVVLSDGAVRKAGGLHRLAKAVAGAIVHERDRGLGVPVEAISSGGAIVWLAPEFHEALPEEEVDPDLDIWPDTRVNAANIYRALQVLGVAL